MTDISVISDKGALAAIEKFGKMIEIFGDMENSDCSCDVCKRKRTSQIQRLSFPKYLDYSLEEGAYSNYYLGAFQNYDQVLADVTTRFLSAGDIVRVTKYGSPSYKGT